MLWRRKRKATDRIFWERESLKPEVFIIIIFFWVGQTQKLYIGRAKLTAHYFYFYFFVINQIVMSFRFVVSTKITLFVINQIVMWFRFVIPTKITLCHFILDFLCEACVVRATHGSCIRVITTFIRVRIDPG